MEDSPDLLTTEQAKVCLNHYLMWCAVHNKIIRTGENGHCKLLSPIGIFKHFQQFT